MHENEEVDDANFHYMGHISSKWCISTSSRNNIASAQCLKSYLNYVLKRLRERLEARRTSLSERLNFEIRCLLSDFD